MSHRGEYSRDDVLRLLRDRTNWGRWGDDDQKGTLNLITPQKRVAAAALVRSGRTVSMSREFPTAPGPTNPKPAQHFMTTKTRGSGGSAHDYYGIEYHGLVSTHIDSLAHVWDENGMWQGRDPHEELTFSGSNWGGVQHWNQGILTRGVLLDVPGHRGEPYVEHERPVHGSELEDIARSQGVAIEPGDALVVYSGRDRWDESHPVWGSEYTAAGEPRRPGLHASCLEFLCDHDCAALAWDMQDHMPNPWGVPWTIHGAIFSYGLALVDHCELAPLVDACKEEGRWEFLFILSPLVVSGGTGSPANPLALF